MCWEGEGMARPASVAGHRCYGCAHRRAHSCALPTFRVPCAAPMAATLAPRHVCVCDKQHQLRHLAGVQRGAMGGGRWRVRGPCGARLLQQRHLRRAQPGTLHTTCGPPVCRPCTHAHTSPALVYSDARRQCMHRTATPLGVSPHALAASHPRAVHLPGRVGGRGLQHPGVQAVGEGHHEHVGHQRDGARREPRGRGGKGAVPRVPQPRQLHAARHLHVRERVGGRGLHDAHLRPGVPQRCVSVAGTAPPPPTAPCSPSALVSCPSMHVLVWCKDTAARRPPAARTTSSPAGRI